MLFPGNRIIRAGLAALLGILAVFMFLDSAQPASAAHAFNPTATLVTQTSGGNPDVFCCSGGGEYHAASISVVIDPANTRWIAWNDNADVATAYAPCYKGYCLGAGGFGTDDFIVLTVTNPGGQSFSATIDNNDGFSFAIGPQQIIFGTAADSPDVLRDLNWGCPNTCKQVLNEAGVFGSNVFDTAGTYTFNFSFRDGPCCGHGHGPVYLLVEPLLTGFKTKGLHAALKAFTRADPTLDYSSTSQSGDTPSVVGPLLDKQGRGLANSRHIPVAGLLLRFSQGADIDLSDLLADADLKEGKAVFHRASYPAGVDQEKELYVRKLPQHDRVRVCPGASTLAEVNSTCANGFVLTQTSVRLSTVDYFGESFWKISGITGTGAQGEEPPPGGEVSSGAGSSSGRGFGISLPDPRTWVMVLSGLALLAVYGGYSWWRRRKKAA